MVNTRLVYVLETEKCISPLQSGFRKGRSTLDNLVFLESQIRGAFVRRNHLVSLFFDIEKAYDRTWRYGILRNMYDFGLRGNIPIFIFNFLAVRYFNVRIGHSSSHKFFQDQGVPQGSVLSVTLFNIHMSNILQLPPSVRGMLYVDDLQVSCQGSDMRLIERQLQTTVNRLVQWCDQNGHTISPSKSSCVHFCRKRNLHPDPSIHIRYIPIPVVSAVRFLGVIFDCKLTFLPHVLYLRNRTSPVTSLYVVCHQPPLELRRRQLRANYFIRAMSVPSHPLKPFALAIGPNRLYEARSFNIKPFSERAKAVLNDAHLNHINIQENNIFAFPPWDIQIFNYHNPFSGFDKADTAAVIYQQLFSFHRNRYSKYIPVYTDGSKTAAHVGCGVIFNNTILCFSFHFMFSSMSVFSAELTAILVALQHIIVSNHRHFCVYTDSMSALESLHFSTEHRHPTVIEILLLLRKLERKGFDVIFSWVPGHVGILGNEQADTAARSMSHHMQRPVCYQDLKNSAQNYVHRVWQETWDQQVLNKLHSIHPSTSHWAALPVRRHDVRLTRLRIGHTRFTHRHLLLGYHKADTADVIYQQLFSFHRNKYSKYLPVYTDESKAVGHVGCGVVFNNTILGFSLHHSMSVFSAELTAILIALQHILISNHRHFCVYTDSMNALESLHFFTERRHPTVIEILVLLRKLERKGFHIIFSWVPGHVGILGNEQADTAARSMSHHMQRPVCYRDLKTSTQNYIHRVWQETWHQQILNKLHSIHPSTSHWTALPVRRHDVRLTRLRIGHTRFTHRHLLLGENALECPSCKVPYSVCHILIHCPIFNRHRITFFHTSVLTLSDLVGESPHQNLFAFVLKIGFLHMI
ncbi:probable RNA-directed DNA polymerase from transposon X-element [Trichonephila clavipes]|nr:probable RNA-directed DNA polymerase from transposon X-element [Trichonephila clavipes]